MYRNTTLYQHLLFWILFIAYSSAMIWQGKKDLSVITRALLFEVPMQIGITYLVLRSFVPKLLQKNHYFLFFFSLVSIVYLAHVAFSLFLDIQIRGEAYPPYSFFQERVTNIYRIVRALVSYLTPAVFLLMLEYYNQQKQTAMLIEQKKTDELKALKNQLNPHFLFNTLNNLYTLALKKSDQTADVIAKLSEMLDYTLYGCSKKFVSLQDEVTLLQNYIALEQVRYNNRVEVIFQKEYDSSVRIAPLLLLTFLENAYKHGVSQEIHKATIEIDLKAINQQIDFYIRNTKPQHSTSNPRASLGLDNIKKQLDLLYPERYTLTIVNENTTYSVTLKILIHDL